MTRDMNKAKDFECETGVVEWITLSSIWAAFKQGSLERGYAIKQLRKTCEAKQFPLGWSEMLLAEKYEYAAARSAQSYWQPLWE
jgi:hypothetical protein